jgi:hypothetical protein
MLCLERCGFGRFGWFGWDGGTVEDLGEELELGEGWYICGGYGSHPRSR